MLSSLGVLARQRVALFLIPRSFLTPVLGTRLLDYGYNCDSSDPWKDCGTLLCLLSLKYWAVGCMAGVCIARGQSLDIVCISYVVKGCSSVWTCRPSYPNVEVLQIMPPREEVWKCEFGV